MGTLSDVSVWRKHRFTFDSKLRFACPYSIDSPIKDVGFALGHMIFIRHVKVSVGSMYTFIKAVGTSIVPIKLHIIKCCCLSWKVKHTCQKNGL